LIVCPYHHKIRNISFPISFLKHKVSKFTFSKTYYKSNQSSDTAMPAQHGYEVCIHNCQTKKCRSRLTSSIFWKKEGHSCKQHAQNPNVHPGCADNCPGFAIMTNPHEDHAWSRPPTDAELDEEHVNETPDPLNPDPPTHRTSTLRIATPPTQVSSLDDINTSNVTTDPPLNITKKMFKIIYVPDPTRAVGEMQAQHDLTFVKTQISTEEYELIQPLGDCVHCMSNKTSCVTGNTEVVVLMQEWVR
jgi:hypothetical protein